MSMRPERNTHPIRCGKTRCSFRGYEGDLVRGPEGKYGMVPHVCPKCGCDSYSFLTDRELKASGLQIRPSAQSDTGSTGNG